jgi:hypothetical protein
VGKEGAAEEVIAVKGRWFAPIGAQRGPLKTRHAVGLPPGLGLPLEGAGAPTVLPWPRVLLLEEDDRGDYLMFRYAADGVFGGDTWHDSTESAERQARYEYGEALGEWRAVPEDVGDPIAYAIAQASGPGGAPLAAPAKGEEGRGGPQ